MFEEELWNVERPPGSRGAQKQIFPSEIHLWLSLRLVPRYLMSFLSSRRFLGRSDSTKL